MAHESQCFHNKGQTWAERAKLGGLRTVLSPEGSERRNLFMHGIHLFAARRTTRLERLNKTVVDFGCGSGRFVRFFGQRGWKVFGTEITPEMIEVAKQQGIPNDCHLYLTNGISIPLPDASVDMVWCCGVLRYSLLVENPVYDKIANEMFRVLRPNGWVVNLEMYVEQQPVIFTKDFEQAGFVTKEARVIHRYDRRPERLFAHRYLPQRWMPWTAWCCAQLRYLLDDASRPVQGLRDYLFVWRKPNARNSP